MDSKWRLTTAFELAMAIYLKNQQDQCRPRLRFSSNQNCRKCIHRFPLRCRKQQLRPREVCSLLCDLLSSCRWQSSNEENNLAYLPECAEILMELTDGKPFSYSKDMGKSWWCILLLSMASLIVSPNHRFRIIDYKNFKWFSRFFPINWGLSDYVGGCGSDFCAPGSSNNQTDSPGCWIDDHCGRHRWHGPLSRFNEICRTRRQSKVIDHIGRGKVIHLVVHQDPRLLRDPTSTEPTSGKQQIKTRSSRCSSSISPLRT